MSSLFGIEASRAAQYLIAFAIILVLVALFGLVLRKLTGGRLMMPGQDRNRSRQPRLGIVDIYELDRQRQLILLRRDNVEHLLLIGGLNDVVIETNIVRAAGARIPAASNDAAPERLEPGFDQPARAPQIEPSGRPSIETQIAAQLGSFVRRPADESDADQELSPVGTISAPVPAHPEPILKPDAVSVSSAPVQTLRAEARTPAGPSAPPPPPPEAVRPEPRPAFTPPPFQSRPTPVPPTPPAQPPASRLAEIVRPPQAVAPVDRPAPAEAPAPDAAVLSDMAKQLEEALKRPPVGAPPPPPRQPAPAPIPPAAAAPAAAPRATYEPVSDEDDLLEPAGDADEPLAEREGNMRNENLRGEAPAAPEPPRPATEPVRPAPPPPPSPMPPVPPVPPAARAAEAPAAPQAAAKPADPLSVEDIEEEFARLLGRPLDTGKKG